MEEVKKYIKAREAEIEKVSKIRYKENNNTTKRDNLRDDADIDYA